MLPSKPIRVEREIRCPLLVHTKLIEPEGKHVHIPKVEDWVDKYLANDNKPEPLIGAEGWDKFGSNDGYKSLIYDRVYVFIDEENDYHFKLGITHTNFFAIEIESRNVSFYIDKLNIPESDSKQTQAFKIANYICSRLCDKIEK